MKEKKSNIINQLIESFKEFDNDVTEENLRAFLYLFKNCYKQLKFKKIDKKEEVDMEMTYNNFKRDYNHFEIEFKQQYPFKRHLFFVFP